MSQYIAAIDQGTTSTRCMVFDATGAVVARHQLEHRQILPRAGWVEHDPDEIWANTLHVTAAALDQVDLPGSDIAACGLTNQRETTLIWERSTGKPVYNAIVWQDTRTDRICAELSALGGGQDRYRDRVGLPLATYFAGPKAGWILDEVPGARERAERGELLFGTVDTWLLWNLTGGLDGGIHATDATNASRTMLMDLGRLAWDPDICAEMGVPPSMLPQIRSNSEVYGRIKGGVLDGVPLAGSLGDQQAATFGQACFDMGDAKNTYGTGNFLLLNTGQKPPRSEHGLLSTVAYQLPDAGPVYALEGSIAVTGSLVQWLRDNVGLIRSTPEIEDLARSVHDNGGVYIVPAFSGLFAPYWRSDARGIIAGLTRYVTKGHLARAALEATAFQTVEVVEAMMADSGIRLHELRVDGGMVGNELLMQFQADILGLPVVRPAVAETTSLGAAYAAGLAAGYWGSLDELRRHWAEGRRWQPDMDEEVRERQLRNWRKAVHRSLDWLEEEP
jgi:glycerol kinase